MHDEGFQSHSPYVYELADSQAEVLRRPQYSVRARTPPQRNRDDSIAPDPRGDRMQEDFGWVGLLPQHLKTKISQQT